MMSRVRGPKLWWMVVAVLAAATAATGQEVFVGTWQLREAEPARFTFAFAEDGDFEAVVPASMFFEADEDEAEDFSLEPFFEDYDYRLLGWWEIDEDGLWIYTDDAEFLGGDTTLEEVITLASYALAEERAAEEDVADEDYQAFEEQIVEFMLTEYAPEDLLFAAYEFFDEEVFGTAFTFSVEDDILTLTDEAGAGEASDLRDVGLTAVMVTSWGQIKAGMR